MAKAVMTAFPEKPQLKFGTTKKEMAQARRFLAETIIDASGG